jgi:hypothetical protein
MKLLPFIALFAAAVALSPTARAVPPPGSGSNNNSQGSEHGVGHQDDGTDDAQGGHADHGNGHGFGHGPGDDDTGDHSVPELDTKTAATGAAVLVGGVLVLLGRRRKKA